MDSDLPPGRPPYYEDLGTVEGSTSSMILQAYHKQIETDPARAPYYLRCLKTLADWRHDSDGRVLAEAVEREYTEGRYTDHDIPKAYNYFQLNPADRTLTDDYIINCFFARLTDAPNDMEPRRQLWRIGDHRQSEKIKAAAEERVANVEQALVFLGAERETGDDFIISMYTAKISDNPASKALAQKAVSLIAEARQSDSLRHFLKTGELGTPEMDVAEAFCLLQIPDRTADESAILAAFSVCCSEAPGQINSYRRALDIIAKERGSAMLSSTLAEDATHTIPVRFDWPVGLRNIGNTCYLNSLLQFYFTIAPFRRMVLNFEDFKMPLDEESVKKKQVGSRKVSLAEIERSQKFVCELRKLFTDMIESPNSAVTPEQELARLTLISSSNEAAIRRKSIISSTRPGLGEIHGMPILGPLGPPTTTENDGTRTAPATATVTEEETSSKDWASDTTLAGLTRTNNSPLTVPDNKENIKLPLDDDDDDNVEMEEVNDSQSPPKAFGPIGPPNRPPPVPPRPAPQIDRQQLIKEEVELGAQQDVTEVINNVLFQTQCAIKPDRIDGDGEQVDLIKNLFYGRNKSHIKSQKGDRSKEELWADIKVDVATGPRDIYSALDGAFDEQWVEVEGSEARQFSTITNIPPVLQVQVQRVQFDQVKKTSFKSTHHLELKETIYLDRYMDASEESEVTKRREESWRWKSELRGLRARKAELINNENWTSLSDVFKDARTSLEDLVTMKDDPETAEEALEIDDSIIETLANLEHAAKEEIERIEAREKHLTTLIETQFSDSRLLPYRLYAVFIHHGSVEFGHYYIYIFDFEKNIWRKYNDSEVTEVHNTAEIFGNTGMINPPTPYFVVYVSDKHKDRAVEPVHRNIVEPVSTLVATNPDNDNAVMIDIPPEGMDVNMSDPPAYEELEGSLPSGMSSKPSSQTPQEPISTPGVLVTTTEVDPSDSPCLNPLKRKGEQGQGRGGWRSSDIDF
ncbi:hypothetical protein AJ80_01678 [Polytolypa hystricis UAMH7299]|uniref:Ubiquitin carboxyl-terminal hydrolase n=1 Tax=Polytolypa hystricis (strain UAMH7299) TaxID=1447883 RepID=A0A2B7YZX9_POLH7|nr:hypothetical protein AJ80_01678 [Polytolypa hystricis UAMH7299]